MPNLNGRQTEFHTFWDDKVCSGKDTGNQWSMNNYESFHWSSWVSSYTSNNIITPSCAIWWATWRCTEFNSFICPGCDIGRNANSSKKLTTSIRLLSKFENIRVRYRALWTIWIQKYPNYSTYIPLWFVNNELRAIQLTLNLWGQALHHIPKIWSIAQTTTACWESDWRQKPSSGTHAAHGMPHCT